MDDTVAEMIFNALKVSEVKIVRVLQLPGKDGKPGITKIQLENLDQKKSVLQAKNNLAKSHNFQRVFIRSSKSHPGRIAEMNM